MSDSDVQRLGITPAEKQDCIEEVNTELSVYLGMLYLIIEVLKDTEDFADELSEFTSGNSPHLSDPAYQ